MNELVDLLARCSESLSVAEKLANRDMSVKFCITTDVDDPLDLRRIRVTTTAKAGLTQGDWSMRILPCPYWDPPMPTVGMSAIIENTDGNPHDALYLGHPINNTNPAYIKSNPLLDDWRRIPGKSILEIGGGADYSLGNTWTSTIATGDWIINVSEGTCTITGRSSSIHIDGDTIQLNALSNVSIVAPQGLTLNGSSLNASNGRWTIDGREIVVLGGRDSDNDIIVSSGQ